MNKAVLYMSMSVDGFIAGPHDGPDNGLGDGGHRLHEWLLIGADSDQLWDLGIAAVALLGTGTFLTAALALWLHRVDAHFARELRGQLLTKMSRLPLGWFS